MPFDERWLFPVVGVIFTLSLLYDLGRGRVRLRGIGVYQRSDEPRSFWLAMGAKLAVTLLLFAIGYVRLAS